MMENKINIKFFLVCLFFPLIFPVLLWANENLLPNGSFEITTVPDIPDCYYQYLGPKKVNDWSELWTIDHKVVYDGHIAYVLRLKTMIKLVNLAYVIVWIRLQLSTKGGIGLRIMGNILFLST